MAWAHGLRGADRGDAAGDADIPASGARAGEADGPRTIVSGLRAHYDAKDLVGKKVLVVANLPTAKLGGVPSAAAR